MSELRFEPFAAFVHEKRNFRKLAANSVNGYIQLFKICADILTEAKEPYITRSNITRLLHARCESKNVMASTRKLYLVQLNAFYVSVFGENIQLGNDTVGGAESRKKNVVTKEGWDVVIDRLYNSEDPEALVDFAFLSIG